MFAVSPHLTSFLLSHLRSIILFLFSRFLLRRVRVVSPLLLLRCSFLLSPFGRAYLRAASKILLPLNPREPRSFLIEGLSRGPVIRTWMWNEISESFPWLKSDFIVDHFVAAPIGAFNGCHYVVINANCYQYTCILSLINFTDIAIRVCNHWFGNLLGIYLENSRDAWRRLRREFFTILDSIYQKKYRYSFSRTFLPLNIYFLSVINHWRSLGYPSRVRVPSNGTFPLKDRTRIRNFGTFSGPHRIHLGNVDTSESLRICEISSVMPPPMYLRRSLSRGTHWCPLIHKRGILCR